MVVRTGSAARRRALVRRLRPVLVALLSIRGVRFVLRTVAARLGLVPARSLVTAGKNLRGQPGGCLVEDAARAAKTTHQALEETCLRTGSLQMREVLAFLVSRGAYTYAELERLLEAYRAPQRRRQLLTLLRQLDVSWLLSTARVVALQNLTGYDLLNARTMYDIADWLDGSSLLEPVHALVYLQLLCELGEQSRADALLGRANLRPDIRAYIVADMVNPFDGSRVGNHQEWLAVVNDTLTRGGLDPIDVPGLNGSVPFDRLTARTTSYVDDGPLVTVIIMTYCPDECLDVAVRSILRQSWRNLELLVVDDGSPPEHQAQLDKWEDVDDRIRIVRLPENRGTYPGRNTALDLARGEFVTFQDSDDWSHPQRIQRQVEPLLADPDLVATRSLCVRVSEQLVFNQLGYIPTRPNASSLLFRRTVMLDQLGYFDPVRKAADSEYYQRITTVFGARFIDIDAPPLAFYRRRTGSLSRSDFRPGWHVPARRIYRATYEYWHRQIAAGEASPYVSGDPEHRVFPAPRAYHPVRPSGPQVYDVVLIGDWRPHASAQLSMLDEVRALAAHGLRVGIVQLESMRFMTSRVLPLCDPVQALVTAGLLEQLALDYDAVAHCVLVEDPSVFQYQPVGPVRMQTGQIFVLADVAPFGPDGSPHRYDASRCVTNIRSMFGKDAIWLPQQPSVARTLAPLLPTPLLGDHVLPPVVDVAKWGATRTAFQATRPVVGCPPPSGNLRWPSDWSVHESDGADPRRFLAGIDFFVWFPAPDVEVPERPILQAMASGAVVLLPRALLATFGGGAVCCLTREVVGHVERLYRTPDLYRRQSERGRAFVRSSFGPDAYVASFLQLAGGSDASGPAFG
jgi:O-antigen biosynthesis protein